ncbi:transposase [Gluconobacter wancherniae]|uniref:transposase n=1 Tax=Gluconobacter wancherniae TaxID=1307955 RepID=UPI001B8BE35E|nr:transposase [Gluconobacter wancherniae]
MSDEEWAIIGLLLLSERGGKARPAHDKRRFLNGRLHILRDGGPWRGMRERERERDGKWNSVYVCFRHWAEQSV